MTLFNPPYTLASPTREVSRLYDDPAEARAPDQLTIHWLRRLGVSWSAITHPWAVYVSRVIFDGQGGYLPSPVGHHVLLLPIVDGRRVVVDIVAWSPKTRELGTRLGVSGLLGEDLIGVDGLGTTGLPIPVFSDVPSWLRADRGGLVVINWEAAAHRLSGVIIKPQSCGRAFVEELKRWLVVPAVIVIEAPSQLGHAA